MTHEPVKCVFVVFFMRDSLCGGVVELILAWAAEAGLNSVVAPEPLDDTGQLGCHGAFLRRARQHKQLPCIFLREERVMNQSSKPPLWLTLMRRWAEMPARSARNKDLTIDGCKSQFLSKIFKWAKTCNIADKSDESHPFTETSSCVSLRAGHHSQLCWSPWNRSWGAPWLWWWLWWTGWCCCRPRLCTAYTPLLSIRLHGWSCRRNKCVGSITNRARLWAESFSWRRTRRKALREWMLKHLPLCLVLFS